MTFDPALNKSFPSRGDYGDSVVKLAVDPLSVALSNPDKGIPPVTATAERVAADSWRVRSMAAASGKWSLSLGIDMAKDDRVDIAAPILIE